MSDVTIGGVRLHWSVEGDAADPALVLLNSIGTDTTLWDAVVPRLLSHFRVIRTDARGHGRSDAPEGDYSLADLAEDVVAVMDAAGVRRAMVVGCSLGGMVAMELALRHPTRVDALGLVCTSAAMDRAAWSDRVAAVRRDGMAAVADLAVSRFLSTSFAAGHPEIVDGLRAGLIGMSVAGYAGAAAAIRDMSLLDRLGALCAPCLVVAGKQDVSTPYEGHGAILERSLPMSTLVQLPCGHLAPVEAPNELARVILSILHPSWAAERLPDMQRPDVRAEGWA
jgi:3-oxoadipate enol-lactonase / 4-carboxymuconolactone decarboxylase